MISTIHPRVCPATRQSQSYISASSNPAHSLAGSGFHENIARSRMFSAPSSTSDQGLTLMRRRLVIWRNTTSTCGPWVRSSHSSRGRNRFKPIFWFRSANSSNISPDRRRKIPERPQSPTYSKQYLLGRLSFHVQISQTSGTGIYIGPVIKQAVFPFQAVQQIRLALCHMVQHLMQPLRVHHTDQTRAPAVL